MSLNPKTISFDDYTILFYIPRVIAKPGIPLTTAQEYAFLIGHAVKMKTPMVNLSITENECSGDGDKENGDDDDDVAVKPKKKVRVCVSVSVIADTMLHSRGRKQSLFILQTSKRMKISKLSEKNGRAPKQRLRARALTVSLTRIPVNTYRLATRL